MWRRRWRGYSLFRVLRVCFTICCAVGTGGAGFAQSTPGLSDAKGQSGLRIVVIESPEPINNMRKGSAREPVVQVQDENGKPVSGALVVFRLPGTGPGGTFKNGRNILSVVTKSNGKAVAKGYPNAARAVRMDVTASFHGQSATAAVAPNSIATSVGTPGGTGTATGGTASGTATSGSTGTATAGGTAGSTAGTAGGAAGAAGAGAGVGAGAGIPAAAVAVAAGAGAAGAAVAAKTAGSGSSPPPPLGDEVGGVTGVIGAPGAGSFGPASFAGRASMAAYASTYRAASTSKAATADLPKDAQDATLPQKASRSGLSVKEGAIIAGVAVGVAFGTWLYLRHQHNRQVMLSPKAVRLRKVPVGSQAHAAIALYNHGTLPVEITSLQAPGGFRLAHKQQLPITVKAGSSAVFGVTFAPENAGYLKDRITLTVSDSSRASSSRLSVDVETEAFMVEPAWKQAALN